MSKEMDIGRSGKCSTLTAKAGLLSLGGVLSYAVYCFVPMVLARLLSREEYGLYGQALLVLNIAFQLALWGLPASVTYFFPNLPEERRAAFLKGTMALFAGAAVLAGGAVFALADPIAAIGGHNGLAPLLQVGSLYLMFLIAAEILGPMLLVTNRVGTAAGIQVLESLLRIAAVLGPVALGYGVRGIFLALGGLLALKLLAAWLLLGPLRRGRAAAALLRQQVRYAAPLGAAAAVAVAAQMGISVVALASFTAATFAVFAVGMFRLPLATIVKRAANPVLREDFSRRAADGDLAGILVTYREASRKTCLLVAPLAVFCFVHAETVVTALFSERYAAAAPVFRLGSLSTVAGALYYAVVPEAMGRSRLPLKLSIVQLLTGLPLAIALTPSLGIMGPVIGEVTGLYLSGVYAMVLTAKLLRVRPHQVLPLLEIGRIALGAILAAAAGLPLGGLGLGPWLELLAQGAVFSAVYGLALWMRGGLLSPDDRAFLHQAAQRIPLLPGAVRQIPLPRGGGR